MDPQGDRTQSHLDMSPNLNWMDSQAFELGIPHKSNEKDDTITDEAHWLMMSVPFECERIFFFFFC